MRYSTWRSITKQHYPKGYERAFKAGYIFTDEHINIISSEENPQAFYMGKIMSVIGKKIITGDLNEQS